MKDQCGREAHFHKAKTGRSNKTRFWSQLVLSALIPVTSGAAGYQIQQRKSSSSAAPPGVLTGGGGGPSPSPSPAHSGVSVTGAGSAQPAAATGGKGESVLV